MNFEFMTIDTPLPPCMPFPRALTGFPVSSTAKVMYCRMLEEVSRVMRKFDLALAEIYFRGRVHAPWLPSSGQGAKGQGRRYAARLALDAL